jgi:hypothetical protein
MNVLQPSKPDRQTRDNPIHGDDRIEIRTIDGRQVVEVKYRVSELGRNVWAVPETFDVLALDQQVSDGRVVTRPDKVVVLGPPNWWLRVVVSRPGLPGQHADVQQRRAQLYEDAVPLPSDWFQAGDYVQVERTASYEPRPHVPLAPSIGWLTGGEGTGDMIARRRG